MRSPGFPIFGAVSLALHLPLAIAFRHLAAAPPAHDPPAALAGDTFEIGDVGDDGREIDLDQDMGGDPGASAALPGPAPAAARPASRARPKQKGHAVAAAAASGAPGDPGSASAALFGAVGERSAVDLATAFTRGFPQAASADPVWATVPFGSAGEATLTITLDATGHVTDVSVTSAPAPLRAGIARTIALIRARSFTSRAATTRLVIGAHVSPDQVHDGLHGDVFALGGSFTGGQGNAFFALNIGRRIDLTIRAR